MSFQSTFLSTCMHVTSSVHDTSLKLAYTCHVSVYMADPIKFIAPIIPSEFAHTWNLAVYRELCRICYNSNLSVKRVVYCTVFDPSRLDHTLHSYVKTKE